MIRDPIGMGWDWEGIKQLFALSLFVLSIIALAGASSGNWYDPFNAAWQFVLSNQALFIGILMFLLMAGYLFHQFDMGRL